MIALDVSFHYLVKLNCKYFRKICFLGHGYTFFDAKCCSIREFLDPHAFAVVAAAGFLPAVWFFVSAAQIG